MFKKVALSLAVLCAASVPAIAGAQALETGNAMTAGRGGNGKLRALTAAEQQALHSNNGNGNGQSIAPRSAPEPFLQKYHSSGARGVRVNNEFMTSSVVTRTAEGKLEMQCLEPGHSGQAPHPAHTTLQPVTE